MAPYFKELTAALKNSGTCPLASLSVFQSIAKETSVTLTTKSSSEKDKSFAQMTQLNIKAVFDEQAAEGFLPLLLNNLKAYMDAANCEVAKNPALTAKERSEMRIVAGKQSHDTEVSGRL